MENNQTPIKTKTPSTVFTPLADDAFLSLGAEQIAYVKSISLPDGAHAIGIFSADGKPMAAAPSFEVAGREAGHREDDPEAVLADPLDIVGGIALGILGQPVERALELVEAQQQGRIEHRYATHRTLLRGASGREAN